MAISIRLLAESLQSAADWAQWQLDSLERFHAYAHRFGGTPGGNVYNLVLAHALAARGLTLEQFDELRKREDGNG